ncbi:MAG: hypothetical protein LQ337_004819 [Flavoplaca oasis]|nr:MAG: hypothetical protein LQ337_004819 [Flavoplaca oasis]
MEKLRWLWDNNTQPPTAHSVYDLIRVYAQPNKVENQPPPDTLDAREATPTHDRKKSPDYTLYDGPDQSQISSHLGLGDSALLRVLKSEGPKREGKKDTEYDSYFLVIVREKSKEIDWKKTPYLQVNKPWDYPTDERKYKAPVKELEQTFIDTAIRVFVSGESKEIIDCFNHQVGEYKTNGLMDRKGGMAKFRKAMEDAGKKPA